MKLLQETLKQIEPANPKTRAAAHAHLEQLTMPLWALGRLMDLAEELAAITHKMTGDALFLISARVSRLRYPKI